MSLDIYATIPHKKIREYNAIDSCNMHIKEKEGNLGFKKQCWQEVADVFHWQITHNLCKMAEEVPLLSLGLNSMPKDMCNLYYLLWCPDELWTKEMRFDGSITLQMIEPHLDCAIDYLLNHEKELLQYEAEEYGSFDSLLKCVMYYKLACKRWPKAILTIDK